MVRLSRALFLDCVSALVRPEMEGVYRMRLPLKADVIGTRSGTAKQERMLGYHIGAAYSLRLPIQRRKPCSLAESKSYGSICGCI